MFDKHSSEDREYEDVERMKARVVELFKEYEGKPMPVQTRKLIDTYLEIIRVMEQVVQKWP